MGIGITRYHADVNATNYQDYWESAVSPPPENATSVCVCVYGLTILMLLGFEDQY